MYRCRRPRRRRRRRRRPRHGHLSSAPPPPLMFGRDVSAQVPEDVAGASFLAIGSAAPEIVINAIGVYKSHKAGAGGQSTSAAAQREANSALQLGLSAIIGSGMIAFLLAPAICALGAKQILKLKRRPLAKNILFYVLSLAALCWFFMDGSTLAPCSSSSSSSSCLALPCLALPSFLPSSSRTADSLCRA